MAATTTKPKQPNRVGPPISKATPTKAAFPGAPTKAKAPAPDGWQETEHYGASIATLYVDGAKSVEVRMPRGDTMAVAGIAVLNRALQAAVEKFVPTKAPAPPLAAARAKPGISPEPSGLTGSGKARSRKRKTAPT
jgi:hypothetical protein